MKVIPLTEDEGFKGEQGKPLVDKKNFPGVRAALETQEADGDKREEGFTKVKGLRRAWGLGRGETRNKSRNAGEGK